MFRPFLTLSFLACVAVSAHADESTRPILALWEFGGWAKPTAERPLGLRFALLEDGRVLFTQDDPAIDALLPTKFFQARLSPDEMRSLTEPLAELLRPQQQSGSYLAATLVKDGRWTEFYLRGASGQATNAVVAGHPCLAKGRVFSATAPVPGLTANQNSADRAALSPAMREACNRLAGFHHASAEPWSPSAVPAMLPPR